MSLLAVRVAAYCDEEHELMCPGLDELCRIACFLARPPELVAEPRLLVNVQLMGARKFSGPRKNGVVCVPQPISGLLRVRIERGGWDSLDQLRGDRSGKLVDLRGIKPPKYCHESTLFSVISRPR